MSSSFTSSASKSLLNTLRGTTGKKKVKERPQLSSQSYTSSSRYSQDDPSTSSMPAVDIDTFNEKEIDGLFENMLGELNLDEAGKNTLRLKSSVDKKTLLRGKLRQDAINVRGPEDFKKRLKHASIENTSELRKLLTECRVSLNAEQVGWIKLFGSRGLSHILDTLDKISKEVNRQEYGPDLDQAPAYYRDLLVAQHECVKCIKAFTNNEVGSREFLRHKDGFLYLVGAMSVANVNCMIDVARMLTAFCLMPSEKEDDEGSTNADRVLEGFTQAGVADQRDRFLPIVSGLFYQRNQALLIACVQLMNAIITSSEDLDFHIHIRNEFMRTGLIDIIDKLESDASNSDDPLLIKHINYFLETRDEDMEDFLSRFDGIRTDIDNLGDCYSLLTRSVKDTVSENYFLSILQHLLMIRDDALVRPAYFKLIENVVSQIVLSKLGRDPDFRLNKRIDFDVEEVVGKIVETHGDELGGGSGAAVKDLKKRLDSVVTAKQEQEARISQALAKLDEYKAEVKGLRTHIDSKGKAPIPKPTDDLVFKAPSISTAPPPPAPPPPPGPGGAPPPPPPPPPPGLLGKGGIPPPPPLPGGGPPPPPPLPGSGGPPPPPGMGPPPPPFGGFGPPVEVLPPHLKPKTKRKADIPMKKLPWTVIPPVKVERDMFWASTNEDKYADPAMLNELKQLFSNQSKGGPLLGAREEADGAKPVKKTKTPLFIQDGKILQSLAILQGSVRLSYADWQKALLEINEEVLSEQTLQQLRSALPPKETLDKLAAATPQQYESMPEGEQLVSTIAKLKRLPARLDAICFKMKYDELLSDVKPGIVAITEACEEVRKSEGFAVFLQMVLLLGNYMVASSAKNAKDTFAFEMSTLTKLNSTKAQDGEKTLLHFLAEKMSSVNPDYANFTQQDFIHVLSACRVAPDQLQKNLAFMKQNCQKVENLLKIFQPENERDKFLEVMSPFLEKAQTELQLVSSMQEKMEQVVEKTLKYYAFDKKKYGIDSFFDDLKTFKEQYETAVRENRMRKEREEKERQREEKNRLEQKKRGERANSRQQRLKVPSGDSEEKGLMDRMMAMIDSGQAFESRRTPRQRTPRSGDRRNGIQRQRSRQDGVGRQLSYQNSGESIDGVDPKAPPRKMIRKKGQKPVPMVLDGNGNRTESSNPPPYRIISSNSDQPVHHPNQNSNTEAVSEMDGGDSKSETQADKKNRNQTPSRRKVSKSAKESKSQSNAPLDDADDLLNRLNNL